MRKRKTKDSGRYSGRKKGKPRKERPLLIERRQLWLAEAEMELLLDCLEHSGRGTSSLHKLIRDEVTKFRDSALKLRELEATAQATAFWEDPEGWMRPLEKYLKSKHKGRVDKIAHEAAETIKQMLQEKSRAKNT